MSGLQIFIYLSGAVGLLAIVARAVKYARAPIHMRWELYPVPHERGRAEYGGSIFEEMDWWNKPKQADKLNELKEMIKEIIFLKGVFEHNRSLWVFSFPFHFGFYLTIAWLGLLLLNALLVGTQTGVGGPFVGVVQTAITGLGYVGFSLVLLGSVGLLARRVMDAEIRRYSSPLEFINLLLIICSMGIALWAHATTDPTFSNLTQFFAGVVTFGQAIALEGRLAVAAVLGGLLVAYIPLSRMAHFVAKYFLYHDVRWSDEANERGSAIEQQIKQAFGYHVGWNAPHIQTGKSWGEVGTTIPEDSK